MNLLIIAGFLGSGKTTLLLQIARMKGASCQRIVVVENEMGEIGIDGDYLSLEGLQVQELFGGCVCCTLSSGLITTLQKVQSLYQPNLVILEATGAARPGDILKTLDKGFVTLGKVQVLTLVDAVRFEMLMEMMTPLLTAQIQAADVVAVNKIDQVEQGRVDRIVEEVAHLNPKGKALAISAEDPNRLDALMSYLI